MDNFKAQALQSQWSADRSDRDLERARYSKHSDAEFRQSLKDDTIGHDKFGDFVDASYDSPDGYAIRYNPVTGEKEMMVAGTRSGAQWGLNALDTVLYGADKVIDKSLELAEEAVTDGLWHHDHHTHFFGKYDVWREKKTKFYEKIAKKNGVEVLYGHSRGGAIVADMQHPAKKVGLDSAMLIANNTSMLNFKEGGLYGAFDSVIGLTGEDNEQMDLGWKMHAVWK